MPTKVYKLVDGVTTSTKNGVALGNSTDTRLSRTTEGDGTVQFEVPERLVLQGEAWLIGMYAKIRHLCSGEPDGIFKGSWDALSLAGITKDALKALQEANLIAWMWGHNTQFLQIKV